MTKAFPSIEVTALVRDALKGTRVSALYPNVHIVHGELDDTDIIEKAAAEAHVVVSTSTFNLS